MKLIKLSSRQLQQIYNRHLHKKRVEERVRKIIEDVRLYGDEAVVKYTRRFDRVKLLPRQLKVSESETNGAYQNISPKFISNLKVIMDNITKFYQKQIKRSWKLSGEDGITLGEKIQPLEKVGIYVPAGTAPLVSSVYMSVLPAKLAGVERIILTSPPNKYGSIDPHILVVANLLKVDEVYKVGGAQAIAALALGTKMIPRVDKVIGPGNLFVNEAKRQVFGYVDIDMIAGPSEVAIIASKDSNPSFVAADLIAQSEHAGGLSILLTNSRKLAQQIKKEVPEGNNGYIIVVRNLDQAVEVVNKIAPEHLQIMVKCPRKIVKKIKNAGAIFIGPYTPVAIGDYLAGPSHVLPTAGTAKFFSGLGIEDFMTRSHVISYTKKALEKVLEPLEEISSIENLGKHLDSVKARFQ